MSNVVMRGQNERICPRNKARNGKMDLLKFIFSVVIVLHHGKNVVGEQNRLFLIGGSFAVEFFFIVSGYLLMSSISKIKTVPNALGTETRRFIVKKYKSFCPEILVAYAIACVFYSIVNREQIMDLFLVTVFEGTLLRMTGIHIVSINAAVWYVSSMLLCMMIIYPLIRKYPDMAVNVILPLSALLLLGYFCGNMRSPRTPTEWMGWTYRGNLRAFSELSIGVCCYKICDWVKQINFTKLGKWLLTVVEYVCYFVLLYYMYYFNATRRDYFFIVVYAIAIIITFSEQTVDAGIFDKKLCYSLGKYSFSVFLSHAFYAFNLNKLLPENFSDAKKMMIYLLCSFVTGFIVMCASDLIRRYGEIARGRFKKLIVVD